MNLNLIFYFEVLVANESYKDFAVDFKENLNQMLDTNLELLRKLVLLDGT